MSRIVILCESIVGHLASIGSPIGKLLLPLTSDQLKLLEGDLPLVLPLSCLEMYTWHNGTELLQGSTFFPWWIFELNWREHSAISDTTYCWTIVVERRLVSVVFRQRHKCDWNSVR